MARVNIAHVDEAAIAAPAGLSGFAAQGPVTTRTVVTGDDRPIRLLIHELAPGARLRWENPPVGHCVYVWKGSALANGTPVKTESAVLIEHNGVAEIAADMGATTLVHFHRPETHPNRPSRAGGNVHIVGPQGLAQYRQSGRATHSAWAESDCPTCELWLHRSTFDGPVESLPHYHTEDEIIFVVRGGMIVGSRVLRPGTALAIDANTTYAFGVEEGSGLSFINFRPTDPHVVMVSRGRPLNKDAPINERENFRADGAMVRSVLAAHN